MKYYFIVLFAALGPLSLCTAAGTCEILSFASPQQSFGTFCAEAVDYPYYLPTNTTPSQLNAIAISHTNSSMSMLPNACQVGIKKLICSSVYLKCVPGIDLTNTSTYNPNIYPSTPIPVPFQKPCLSVCSVLIQACIGLPDLLGLASNCSSQTDYGLGTVDTYDPSNSTTCNSMTANVSVANSMEPYLKAADLNGACYGITTSLFVPPGNAVSSSLAPMLPSYIVQSLIESQLATNFAALPVFLSPQCHAALRRYFCSSAMLQPQMLVLRDIVDAALIETGVAPADTLATLSFLLSVPVEFLNVTLSHSFYLYSYPQQQICLDYASSCAAFIAAANKTSLTPRCSAVDSSGANLYPLGDQTILSLTVSGVGALQINTSANTLSGAQTAEATFQTTCPAGYVVPDNPNDPRVKWVSGSGCAVSCKVSSYTTTEWGDFMSVSRAVAWVSLVFGVAFTAVFCRSREKMSTEYGVLFYVVTTTLLTLFFCIMRSNTFEAQFCKNNAVPYSNGDGFNWCSVHSVLLWYFGLAAVLSAVCVSTDQVLKHVLNMESLPTSLWYVYLFVVCGLPWISIIWVLANNDYGYQNLSLLCLGNPGLDNDFSYFWYPIIALAVLNVTLIIPVLIAVVRKYFTKAGDRIDISPILFILFFIPCEISIVQIRYSIASDSSTATASFIAFTKCIFAHYNGNDSTWQSVCGFHPEQRPAIKPLFWIYACINGLPMFLILAYLVNPGFYRWVSGTTRYKRARVVADDTPPI